MKGIYKHLTGWIFFITLFACSNEVPVNPPVGNDPFKEGKVPISMPVTKAINDADPENKVASARLIVIKNSVVANNTAFSFTSLSGRDSVYVHDSIPVGTIDLFIVVNEKPEWKLDNISLPVGSVCFPGAIENKPLPFTDYPVVDNSHPIPMYRGYRDLDVSNTGEFKHEGLAVPMDRLGEVYRLYAKVTLVVNSLFADLKNGGSPIQLDSMYVRSMPRYSTLNSSNSILYPVSGGYFDGTRTRRTPNYVADNAHFRDSMIWYIPEHRVSEFKYMTYLYVKASLEGNTDPAEQEGFKIAIGDGIERHKQDDMLKGNIPLSDMFITRNTHYKVNANIISFDKMSAEKMTVTAKIIPWNGIMIDSPDAQEYKFTISQSEITIPAGAYSPTNTYVGTVSVSTDYSGGWSVAEKPAGVDITVSRNTLQYTISGGSSPWKIKVKAGKLTRTITITTQ